MAKERLDLLESVGHRPGRQVETPRRWELVNAGLVRDSGMRRKTRSRRNAAVWIATESPARD